jgi:hypothetical protein
MQQRTRKFAIFGGSARPRDTRVPMVGDRGFKKIHDLKPSQDDVQ